MWSWNQTSNIFITALIALIPSATLPTPNMINNIYQVFKVTLNTHKPQIRPSHQCSEVPKADKASFSGKSTRYIQPRHKYGWHKPCVFLHGEDVVLCREDVLCQRVGHRHLVTMHSIVFPIADVL